MRVQRINLRLRTKIGHQYMLIANLTIHPKQYGGNQIGWGGRAGGGVIEQGRISLIFTGNAPGF